MLIETAPLFLPVAGQLPSGCYECFAWAIVAAGVVTVGVPIMAAIVGGIAGFLTFKTTFAEGVVVGFLCGAAGIAPAWFYFIVLLPFSTPFTLDSFLPVPFVVNFVAIVTALVVGILPPVVGMLAPAVVIPLRARKKARAAEPG